MPSIVTEKDIDAEIDGVSNHISLCVFLQVKNQFKLLNLEHKKSM